MNKYPWIPVEEEGRLNDTYLRKNFLERVYALYRWNNIPDADYNFPEFIHFHARHKLMLMARDQVAYQQLGRWAAETTLDSLKERRRIYLQNFMLAMQKKDSKGKHVNVLMHVMGYLKKQLNRADKQELLTTFESYRRNHLPLTAVLLLLKHHFRNYPDNYIQNQHYLEPIPDQVNI